MGILGNPSNLVGQFQGALQLGKDLGAKLNGGASDKAYAAGFATEKVAEVLVLGKLAGGSKSGMDISNPVPDNVARVVPNTGNEITSLGRPGASDVFVTASADIKNMDAAQLADRLTIPHNEGGFLVFEFPTPDGIATPKKVQ